MGVGVGALLAACGSSSHTTTPLGPGFYITIASQTFAPANLAVPPGATVTVLNGDSIAHTVTSQVAAGNFTPGSVAGVSFDTGTFTGNASFTMPTSVPTGTVIPYYCKVHTSMMVPSSPTITIDPSAQPAMPPPGFGGGGGGGGGGGY